MPHLTKRQHLFKYIGDLPCGSMVTNGDIAKRFDFKNSRSAASHIIIVSGLKRQRFGDELVWIKEC